MNKHFLQVLIFFLASFGFTGGISGQVILAGIGGESGGGNPEIWILLKVRINDLTETGSFNYVIPESNTDNQVEPIFLVFKDNFFGELLGYIPLNGEVFYHSEDQGCHLFEKSFQFNYHLDYTCKRDVGYELFFTDLTIEILAGDHPTSPNSFYPPTTEYNIELLGLSESTCIDYNGISTKVIFSNISVYNNHEDFCDAHYRHSEYADNNSEYEGKDCLKVYPNPFSKSFTIEIPDKIVQVEILDINGHLIKTIYDKSMQIVTIPDDHPSGIYFVKFIYLDKTATVRIIKG